MAMNIQRLGPTWAPAYRQLMLDAYARHPEAFTSSPEERAALPLDWWERRLREGDQAQERVWGVTQGTDLLGVVGLSCTMREKVRHKATLFGLYVPDQHRRLGLAKRLLEELLAQAALQAELRVIQLTVTQGNHAALALYERAGFTVFGNEPLAVAMGNTFLAKLHLWYDLENLRRASRNLTAH
ncbi:GNAT family N-acetyltransferase [Pseudomonas oryzihabitans]|nr:GNAT family N-acetyltransferase [Pseudomonas oryzihabitans]MCI1009467.1 GNAT family N-acetyltransferase [Pseudomonas oryzihabitans]